MVSPNLSPVPEWMATNEVTLLVLLRPTPLFAENLLPSVEVARPLFVKLDPLKMPLASMINPLNPLPLLLAG